ncbi:hypothetical protein BH11ACT7_BH11ACT7_36500 [soil metagenome]
MPADDLLRFIGEPLGYSRWWMVAAVLGIVAVIVWCVGVYVATMPAGRLQRLPVVEGMQAQLLRRRFAKSVRRIGDRYRSGALTSAQACAELSGEVRNFLSAATGTPAQYMHVSEIAGSTVESVAGAAPLLDELTAAQFDPGVDADVGALQHRAEELISAWS